ncbi:hypothetical protein JKP88DRAFT_272664 [Tribonema minus]|uniref:BTB domain-containing protein n=1 Tax=Tribonema minus TaxID=303371 RepID=A0A836CHQ5_9STRA|nr:hypothetical protein JKP88DRAFT_272664 [Tribonema minus]
MLVWEPNDAVSEYYNACGMCDLAIQVFNWSYRVHRVIVTKSNVIQAMLTDNGMPLNAIALSNIHKPLTFGKTLDCMYALYAQAPPGGQPRPLPAYVCRSATALVCVASMAHRLGLEGVFKTAIWNLTTSEKWKVAYAAAPDEFAAVMGWPLLRELYDGLPITQKMELAAVALPWCGELGELVTADSKTATFKENVKLAHWTSARNQYVSLHARIHTNMRALFAHIPGDVVASILSAREDSGSDSDSESGSD